MGSFNRTVVLIPTMKLQYPINHPVNVKALYYVELHGNSKVDISNLHNALHDILVKYRVLADDESRIVAGTDGSRVIIVSNNPRTEVFIEDMPEALP